MNARNSTIVRSSLALTSLAMCGFFGVSCANSDDNGPAGGAGGGGQSGSLMAGFTVDDGGYVTTGTWKGWAWPATEGPNKGTTITPAPSDQNGPGFSAVKAGSPLCVSGSVIADAAYGGVGLLGVNINQDKTPANAPQNTWTPTGNGVKWQITNKGGSPLRIQINGVQGYPNEAWCYPISTTATSSGGAIKWADFNSKCWGEAGSVTYNGTTPLTLALVVVPGLNTANQPFEFCLEGLSPN